MSFRYKGPASRNDIVDDFVTMLALDAIFAALKAIVDDIVTCGMTFIGLLMAGMNGTTTLTGIYFSGGLWRTGEIGLFGYGAITLRQ